MLSGHHESHKDQEQEKTVQQSVSRQQTNLGIRRDEWDHQSQTSNANCCCQDSYLIAQGKQWIVSYQSSTGNWEKQRCL